MQRSPKTVPPPIGHGADSQSSGALCAPSELREVSPISRRDHITWGHVFFAVVVFRRVRIFDDPLRVSQPRAAFGPETKRRPFHIDAILVMQDQVHAIWTLPQGHADYSI